MVDAKSVFGSIKSKLGLDSNQQQDEFDEEYDEYDEYGEYDDYDDDYGSDYDDRYDSNVTTRSARSSMPRLVTMSEARESARSTSFSSNGSRGSSVRNYGRTMVDSSLPPTMTPEGTAAVSAASNRRSEGLDSLFSPTSKSESRTRESAFSADLGSGIGSRSASVANGTAPTASSSLFGSTAALSIPGQRQLQVIRPKKYDDVENVTKVLKSGDVAILSLGDVPADLMKRLLDFSFGVASAMDASVECIGQKVFAITRNEPLDNSEREDLKALEVI